LIGLVKIKELGKNNDGNGNETIQNKNIFNSKGKKNIRFTLKKNIVF
jgi:hypothetical protein